MQTFPSGAFSATGGPISFVAHKVYGLGSSEDSTVLHTSKDPTHTLMRSCRLKDADRCDGKDLVVRLCPFRLSHGFG